ncbi:DUF6879 family protein [Nocardiopsis mangrovi]|uniref:DUF6879 family protein n=1 Tax=Nocardiopsis mangrovi TaxID=1179818 RepID=A0ABV9E1E0_9ACTN
MTGHSPERGHSAEYPISPDEFGDCFSGFQSTAFRLETLQDYSAADEPAFRKFLAGESAPPPGTGSWPDEVRSGIDRGLRYDRVHVVTEPLSDYVRFECAWGYRRSVRAGENIRILPVPEGGWPDGLPHLDYWLFDSATLVRMDYSPDHRTITRVAVSDPEQIAAANAWRERAMRLSVPFTEYAARFDDAMLPLGAR